LVVVGRGSRGKGFCLLCFVSSPFDFSTLMVVVDWQVVRVFTAMSKTLQKAAALEARLAKLVSE